MAIKMRYLYASGKKKFATIGDIIKQKFSLTSNNSVDVIPPAYPCDKERFVFIGISVKDEPENKVKAIEIIDKKVLPVVLEELEKYDDYKVMILPDHPTPLVTMTHARDPVPFMIYHKNGEKDGVETVTENTAKSTGVYFDSGVELMKYFLGK